LASSLEFFAVITRRTLGRSSRQPPAKVTHNYLRTQPDIPVGFYVSRQLAEANEGILTLERTEPGVGTSFALDLPLANHGRGN